MNMKKLSIILAALLMVLPVGAQGLRRKPSKKELIHINEVNELKRKLDSLKQVVDSLRSCVTIDETVVENELEGEVTDYTPEVTDSLMNLWYQKTRSINPQSFEDLNMDSVAFSSNVSDSVMIQRLKDMNSFFTLPFNETVKNYMVLYSERMPSRMSTVMGLSEYYFPIFEATLARYNLPLELKYMAIIESMLNPVATSRAGARGMWQFMYTTARIYGLHIDSFIDERLDVEKAVDAAARYMRDSYRVFGDWALAISSYNCGAGNVSKAIRRAGGSREFWDIYPYLPRETRGYVPAFIGAMYAMTYSREYAIYPSEVGMPARVDTFHINRKLHFQQINEVVGVSMDDLHNLNPQYIHDIIPGTLKDPCVLQLPYTWTPVFMSVNQDSLYNHRASQLMSEEIVRAAETRKSNQRIAYKVKSGDYLGRIASRYGVSVNNLKKWNNLKSNNLRVGQTLYIYKNGGYVPPAQKSSGSGASSSSASSSQSSASKSAPVAGSGRTYTVKNGDSFYTIAQQFPGVSAQNIMDHNGISSSKLKPGMVLRIPDNK